MRCQHDHNTLDALHPLDPFALVLVRLMVADARSIYRREGEASMKKFYDLIRLCLPWNAYRIIVRGSQAVAQFRCENGREPTQEEWSVFSEQVGREVLGEA